MGDTDQETLANVTLAEFDFDDEAFDNISDDAKNFIEQLLLKDKESRHTAKSALQHCWLAQDNTKVRNEKIKTDKLRRWWLKRKWQSFRPVTLLFLSRLTHVTSTLGQSTEEDQSDWSKALESGKRDPSGRQVQKIAGAPLWQCFRRIHFFPKWLNVY
ncbi:hypothetical protein Bbelb_334840 [Branchiostoma belcheri]|nr:hypothetical protein Bbelb_334840 [Branchiostoma belcheri]